PRQYQIAPCIDFTWSTSWKLRPDCRDFLPVDGDVDVLLLASYARVTDYKAHHQRSQGARQTSRRAVHFADAALFSLENVQTACAVDQINQPAVIEAHVIALDSLGAGRNVRHEGSYLTRRVRVRDIDDSKAMREPSHRNFRAAYLLAELMHPGIVGLRRSVLFRHLETGEGDRFRFVGYVYNPQESWRRHFQSHHILIGNQHDATSTHRKRYRQCRVRRPRKGRPQINPRDNFWLLHFVNPENNDPAVPVTGIQTVADPYRMMAAMGSAFPARLLAPGNPLPGHPPA